MMIDADEGRVESGHTIAMSSAASCLERGNICAYVAHADQFARDSGRVARSLAWMSAPERERAARFRHDQDRAMFGLGREMARTLVGSALGVAPDAWSWREGPHGRPEVAAPDADLHFNISHSAGLVMCVLARGRAVGVDLEDRTRRTPDPAIVTRYCSRTEADDVCAQGDAWPDRFLRYWTLKEAYLKARGLGIAVHLADISFDLGDRQDSARISFLNSLAGTDDRWAFHLLPLEPHHLAAVATEIRDGARPSLSMRPY
jgi:4'-phosphopantetheinyl transferase